MCSFFHFIVFVITVVTILNYCGSKLKITEKSDLVGKYCRKEENGDSSILFIYDDNSFQQSFYSDKENKQATGKWIAWIGEDGSCDIEFEGWKQFGGEDEAYNSYYGYVTYNHNCSKMTCRKDILTCSPDVSEYNFKRCK